MSLPPFKLEQFFAQYEFSVPHLLCASDIQGLDMRSLIALADDESKALWDELVLGYSEAYGHPLLRSRIAADYPGLGKDDVLVCNPQEVIFLFMHAALKPGDHVICAWPAYQSLFEVARDIGCDVSLVALDPKRKWQLHLDDVREMVRPNTKLIVVNTPHNPTGTQMNEPTLRALSVLAEEIGAYFFCDEVYRFLEHDLRTRLPPAATLSPRSVSFSALSKAYGLAGLRIGWIASRDRTLIKRMQELKDFTTICNSAPSEVLACMAIAARDVLVQRSLAIVRRNIGHYEHFFARHPKLFEWNAPEAGSTALIRYKLGKSEVFADTLVRESGVLLMPGNVFDLANDYLRIGLGRENTVAGLEAFEAFLHKHQMA